MVQSDIIIVALALVFSSAVITYFVTKHFLLPKNKTNTSGHLAALERLTLFLERNDPQQLIGSMGPSVPSAGVAHTLFTEQIRTEFQHNATQQLYVSEDLWQRFTSHKHTLTSVLNHAAIGKDLDASPTEYFKNILTTWQAGALDQHEALKAQVRAEAREILA